MLKKEKSGVVTKNDKLKKERYVYVEIDKFHYEKIRK